MKKFLAIAAMVIFAACNSNDSATTETAGTTSDSTMKSSSPINSPYPISYSSDFEMGDNKCAEAVLTLWKDYDNGNLLAHKEMFADSVVLNFWDGSIMMGPKDSVLAAGQAFRTSLGKAESRVAAVVPLKSKDKDENWALIWGTETDTDSKGKVDSFHLQETWRFNKDGKADLMFQYKANAKPQ